MVMFLYRPPEDEQERLWLENEIFVGDRNLIVHSNDIGDTVGWVSKVTNVQYVE